MESDQQKLRLAGNGHDRASLRLGWESKAAFNVGECAGGGKMSDTPETDAQLTTFTSISKLKKHFVNRRGTVSAELARGLERERNVLRGALIYIASLDTSQDASPEQCAAAAVAMFALDDLTTPVKSTHGQQS
jgi:hypothetical protein